MSEKFPGENSEQDSPIFIFPEDEASESSSDSGSGLSRLSFGKVSAPKKEKEFVYMPFLDDKGVNTDEDEDEGEASKLSFSKVKAAKKESEFIFMPFLNDTGAEETVEEEHRFHPRPDGTVFDEGLILIPMSPLTYDDEDEAEDSDADEEQLNEDTGIYVTDTEPGSYIPMKRSPKNSSNSKKKNPPPGRGSKNGKPRNKNSAMYAEEQFRAAMKNINPDIRRAAMRDPVQRAALEQAVRIALVQQAAQEAVARTTGSVPIGFSGYAQNQPTYGSNPPSGGKKSGRSRNSERGSSMSVKGFQFSGFDSAPSDFSVGESAQPIMTSPAAVDSSDESIDFASTLSPQPTPAPVPEAPPEPIFSSAASVAPQRVAPNVQQDPALSTLSRSGNKPVSFSSPAAIRAAMRAGVDISALQQSPAAVSVQSNASSQKIRQQEFVDTKRSGCLIWIIILFFAFFVGLLTIAIWPALSTEKKYLDASSFVAAGDYLSAAEIYDSLDDYKDCETRYDECVYSYASQLENAGSFDEAINYFNLIPDYPASSERIAECHYTLGKRYLNEGKYSEAYDHLYLIPKYGDAGELAKQANYQCALEFFNAGSYDDAATRFSMFDDYLDSHTFWQTAVYNSGRQSFQQSAYQAAYDSFSQLGTYSDSEYYTALSRYYILSNGDTASLNEVFSVVSTLTAYGAQPDYSADAFAPVKLSGMWQNNATGYFISYQLINNDSVFKTNMTDSGETLTISGVFFEGNQLCYRSGNEKLPLLTLNYFDPQSSVSPDLVNVYSFLLSSELSFIRLY